MSDKIEVIENLGKVVDKLLIGGAMAYTFLKAQGLPTGKSLVEEDKVELAKKLLRGARRQADVAGGSRGGFGDCRRGARMKWWRRFPADKIGVDIGPKTIDAYAKVIGAAKTVIWNGPMGIFEKPPFDKGTVALAKAVADSGATSRGGRRRFGEGDQGGRVSPARSRTFPRAAGRRWNFWRGSSCRVLPHSSSSPHSV